MPRVSVLLPVRDAEATLEPCLRSLAAQTLIDHEVVVVDDGSEDASPTLLARAARADRRVRVITTPRRGLPHALNVALAAAGAALLARMDADDVAHPERLAVQAHRLEQDHDTAILGCRVRLVSDRNDARRGMQDYVSWLNGLLDHQSIVRDLYVESPLAHPSVMMRTSALRALRGYREFDGPEDYDLWLRAHQVGLRFAKTPEVLLDWSDHPRRLTRTDPRYRAVSFLVVKTEALERNLLTPGRPVVLWGAGPVGKSWSKLLRQRDHVLAAFVDVDPRKIGQTVHGIRVVGLDDARRFPGALHLAAVGRPDARARIRDAVRHLGLREGLDFVAVA